MNWDNMQVCDGTQYYRNEKWDENWTKNWDFS